VELRSGAEFALAGRRLRAAWIEIAVLLVLLVVLAIVSGDAQIGRPSSKRQVEQGGRSGPAD
jgi:hypothetical protein